jgi:hypothetical protein
MQAAALRQQFANRTGAQATQSSGLIVDVAYTDTTGQRVVLEKNIQVQFRGGNSTGAAGSGNFAGRGSSSSGFIGGTLFWIIIIVVVLGGGYLLFVRKKGNAVNTKPKKRDD